MINETIAGYRIIRELGRGGMAIVYLAEHELLQKKFALKILHHEFARNSNIRGRFLKEARIMAGMSHSGIVKVINLIDAGDIVAIVMEYIDGETLKEYLDRKARLSQTEIVGIFLQMLKAVEYAHNQNIVHRDLKPANFMIDHARLVKLMDFGIAKTTNSNSLDHTQTGTQIGTPMYMSPEQVKGTKDVGHASDIYSLGVVQWQMTIGKKPYDSNILSQFDIQMKILQESLPKTGTNWDKIISKATSKEISHRYRSIFEYYSEVINEITDKGQEILSDKTKRDIAQKKSTGKKNPAKKINPRLIATLSAIILALVTIIIFNQRDLDQDNDGIMDKNDICPDIFGLAALNGCPDSDSDGIADRNDLCPETSGLRALKGCPDKDNDGIADKDDQCPELFGFYITNGCPAKNDNLSNPSTVKSESELLQIANTDSDNDGITDDQDLCKYEYGYARSQGCPDNDYDGIANNADICPDDFGPVITSGCPDSDHDGVINKNDACPNDFGNNPNGCFYYKTVTFYNKSSEKVWLAVGYNHESTWFSQGWYTIDPYSDFTYPLPNKFNQNAVYWYANTSNSGIWSGEYQFCVNLKDAFFYRDASYNNNCNTKGFLKLTLTSENTKQSLVD